MYNAKADEPSVSQECNASASPVCNAEDDSASPVCSESFLRNRLTKPVYGKEGINDSAAPTGGGLSASAEAAPEAALRAGFEALYRAYGVRREKESAWEAYKKLDLNPAFQEYLIDAATAWRLAADRKPGCKRRYLVTWLKEQRYDEDAPGQRDTAGAKGKSAKGQPANDDGFPATWHHTVEITDADVAHRDEGSFITLKFRGKSGDVNGRNYEDEIAYEGDDAGVLAEGRRRLDALCNATGVAEFEDTDVFLNAVVDVVWANDCFHYFAHPSRANAA